MLRRLALLAVILALVAPVAASDHDSRLVGGKLLLGYVAEVNPPDTTCVGGVPAYGYCSEGTTQVISRFEVQTWMPASPSKAVARLLNGPITFVVNCDMNGAYRGPCWGTFEWNVPGVGTWTGFWTMPVMDLITYESRLSMEGIGSGGEINGKHLELNGASAPGDWYVASTVRIQ